MSFTKEQLKSFRADFTKAVKDVEKQYNVAITLGAIKYSNTDFTTKLTATSLDEKGVMVWSEMDKMDARLADFPEAWQNAKFTNDKGTTFAVVGYNSRRSRFPVTIQDVATCNLQRCTVGYVRSFIK